MCAARCSSRSSDANVQRFPGWRQAVPEVDGAVGDVAEHGHPLRIAADVDRDLAAEHPVGIDDGRAADEANGSVAAAAKLAPVLAELAIARSVDQNGRQPAACA